MEKKSLLSDVAVIAGLGLAGLALVKIIERVLSRDLGTGTKDRPIIVSGGSLYLSSRATFTVSGGQLTVNMGSYSVTAIDVSTSGDDPVPYQPSSGVAWTLTLTGDTSNLIIQSNGASQITFSGSSSDFNDVMSSAYFGVVKKHKAINTISNLALSGAGMNLSQAVSANEYYVVMHYGISS